MSNQSGQNNSAHALLSFFRGAQHIFWPRSARPSRTSNSGSENEFKNARAEVPWARRNLGAVQQLPVEWSCRLSDRARRIVGLDPRGIHVRPSRGASREAA